MLHLDLASTFFLLLCGHVIADFAIQTEWVATNKNRNVRKQMSAQEQAKTQIIWPHLLTAHSLHHGLFVFLITGQLWMGIGETLIHWGIDFAKCEGWFGFHTDQVLHVLAKVAWIVLLAKQSVP